MVGGSRRQSGARRQTRAPAMARLRCARSHDRDQRSCHVRRGDRDGRGMTHTWWYLARSSGLVAWALLATAVLWGLILATRIFNRVPSPKWFTDLHRFLGGAAVVFTAVHVATLVADSYVHFGWAEVLVPFASKWKPVAVAWGVISLWILVAVEASSLMMRHLPRRVWHAIHLSSFVLFLTATAHA